MARYIDADELLANLKKLREFWGFTFTADGVDEAIDEVEDAPDADIAPKSEVIDEFVKRLKNAPIKCSLPLFGLQTKGEIEEYFNDIMLQFGNAIDNIAKEMKGE
jgi:hypothetical protein